MVQFSFSFDGKLWMDISYIHFVTYRISCSLTVWKKVLRPTGKNTGRTITQYLNADAVSYSACI